MAPGTKVYLNWYDFNKKTEFLLKGEVVDNSDYQGTQWADFIYVSIQLNAMSAPICHHFLPQQLSTDASNVPHDDCYLLCGQQQPQQKRGSNPWLTMTEFKRAHWDDQRNHLQTDALDEFYRLFLIAINWRLKMELPKKGLQKMKMEYPMTPQEAKQPLKRIVSDKKMTEIKEQLKETIKPKKNPTNIVELNLFE